MDICVILDRPDTIDSSLDALEERFRGKHQVRRIAVRDLTVEEAIEQESRHALADLYLLKSDREQGIKLGEHVEQQGAMVVNSPAVTEACRDRNALEPYMQNSSVPWPHTVILDSLNELLANENILKTLPFPGIVKSRFSIRGDLVAKVAKVEELQALAAEWGEEPIIFQEFVEGDGWDIKMWIIDQTVFAARRRSPLDTTRRRQEFQLDEDEIQPEWKEMALSVGKLLNLHVYGIDFLLTKRGPVIIDVNAFHTAYGVIGIEEVMVKFVERLIASIPEKTPR